MPISLSCAGCNTTLKVPDAFAGKKVKCPKCQAAMVVPAPVDDLAPVEVMPEDRVRDEPRKKPERREDDDDRPRPEGVRQGRDRDRDDDDRPRRRDDDRPRRRDRDDDDDRPVRKKASWKPCPKCEAPEPKRVLWTPWGSFYGPAMFNHVRCQECGYAYNGKTGGSNLVPAIIMVAIPLVLILGIVGFVGYLVLTSMGYLK